MNWSYEKAGVNIDKGDAWVEIIKSLVSKRTALGRLPQSGGIGGFSGLWPLGGGQYLSACCDGVGTKLEVAKMCKIYRGLGQDLVAMNVNDLITCGARPLFFLDYIACGKLDTEILSQVVEGVLDGCEESSCALLGGETAEMPGVYDESGFDLAGFSVGIADEASLVNGSDIAAGDIVIGLASSGIHSNGYSLVRKTLIEDGLKIDLESTPAMLPEPLAQTLMKPTRIYVKQAACAIKSGKVNGMAHITGGGLEGNIARTLPSGLSLDIDYNSWERPAVFNLISSAGVAEEEMRKVFNLGIGYVIIASKAEGNKISAALSQIGEAPVNIGRVI